MRIKEKLSFFLGWPLALIALYYLSTILSSKWGSVATQIAHANVFLVGLSIVMFVGYFAFRIIVWNRLIELQGNESVQKKAALSWMMSELKRFVPGSIWGSVSRVKSFDEYTGSKKSVVKYLGVELYLVPMGASLMALLGLPRFYQTQPLSYALVLTALIFTILFAVFVVKHIPMLRRFFNTTSVSTLIRLALLSSIAFFFFGFGSFLAFKSVFPVSINDWIYLTGYFNIALLLGYLTVITPLGLGVREAIITVLLTPIFGSEIAVVAAIFVRLCNIAGELLAISIILLWQKVHTARIRNYIQQHLPVILLATMTIVYALYFGFVSIQKHNVYLTGRYDLGNMDQVIWNTSEGRIFQFTNPQGDGMQIMSRLGIHADIFLILLAPFYFVWSDPRMLLLLQTLAIASGGIFVYLLGKRILQNTTWGIVLAALYFLNPLVQYVNVYDFHAVSFAIPLLLGGFYFLISGRMVWSIIFLVLAGLTKENIWICNALLGIFMILRKERVLGILFTALSIAAFVYFIFIGIPTARGAGSHFALMYYSDFGGSTKDVFLGIMKHPVVVLNHLFDPARLWYLFEIFAPLGFISLISFPYLLFAGGDFGINLLSSNPNYYQIWYQYTTVITPFLFIAAIYGVSFLVSRWPRLNKWAQWYLLITTIISAFTLGPLPGSYHHNTNMYEGTLSYTKDIDKALALIPPHASIAATNNLGAHLMRRDYIYTLPTGVNNAEYVAFLLTDWAAQPSPAYQKQLADSLRMNPNYETIFAEKDFVLFKKIR